MLFAAGGLAAEITVYKSASCDCCSKWARYLEQKGFLVKTHDVADVSAYKDSYGVPAPLHACHTAVVEGYVIEGHVPAEDIERLLKERPAITGLAVPGMPAGTPGMEGSTPAAFEVLSFDGNGEKSVYARHPAKPPAR